MGHVVTQGLTVTQGLKMKLNLEDRVVVVVGGASGIGRAVAAGFIAESCRVAIWDVATDVEEVARKLGSHSDAESQGTAKQKVIGLQVDVCDQAGVEEALAQSEAELGPVQHLVHSAAIGSGKFGFPFTNLSPSDWPQVLDVNIMGMVNVAHAVAIGMQDRQEGTFVFISSVAGQIGSPTDPPYSASKAANINFAQCMAKDLAASKVRVNSVCPGMVETPLNKSVWQSWNDRQPPDNKLSYADWADEKIRTIVPLGDWQQPEDIADMCVFLSSDRARHVTGQTINVDGGYVMHW